MNNKTKFKILQPSKKLVSIALSICLELTLTSVNLLTEMQICRWTKLIHKI